MRKYQASASDRLMTAMSGGTMTVKEIAATTGLHVESCRVLVKKLMSKGKVEQVGTAPRSGCPLGFEYLYGPVGVDSERASVDLVGLAFRGWRGALSSNLSGIPEARS